MDGPIVMNQKFLTTTLGFIFDCSKTEAPAYTFTAHMAPLGLTFYREGRLLKSYEDSVFIAFHGSWNRSISWLKGSPLKN